jgi:hypothetical protein
MCIAGNKKDLVDQWKVTEEQLKSKAKSIDSSYILTSALDDEGIEEAFIEIVRNISIGRFTSIKAGAIPNINSPMRDRSASILSKATYQRAKRRKMEKKRKCCNNRG